MYPSVQHACRTVVPRSMTSRIHFKLKNALDKKSVAFDGAVIQVGDIKRLIAEQLGTSD